MWSAPYPMVYVGLLLLFNYFGGKLVNYLKFLRVTGYLVAWMLLGPSVAGEFPEKIVQEALSFITEMALAVIAFSVDGSLHLGRLKRIGGQILWITLAEATGAFVLTTLILMFCLPAIQGSGFLTPNPEFIHGSF